MFRLFAKTRNFSPLALIVTENGEISGLLLAVIIKEYSGYLGFLSSRTVVYGGPLVSEDKDDPEAVTLKLLKELIKNVEKETIFIQFRNFHDRLDQRDVYERCGFKFLDRHNYLVDTTSERIIRKRMSESKRRQVKKGLKAGAGIIAPENEDQVKAFYAILHDLYKYKVKKPLPDYSFFRNFYLQSEQGKLGIIRLVKYENKIIGGILSPVFNHKVIYEWYVCGLDQEYRHVYPSVLATWAAIDYALKNGIGMFDFMGVGVPDKDYGVREFKSKFGGDLVNYGRFGRINNKFLYAITELGFNVLALLRRI